MKKILLALVAVLGFAAFANAQHVRASFRDAKPYNPEEWPLFTSIELFSDGTCSMKEGHFGYSGSYIIDFGEDEYLEPGGAYKFVMVWINDNFEPCSAVGEITLNKNGTMFLSIGEDRFVQEERE